MPEPFYVNKKEKHKKYSYYLTHQTILRLQHYYGLAIRGNAQTSVPIMRNAVGTVLFHCSEATDRASRHQFCPKSSDSWCKSQVDQFNNTSKYKEKPGLPIPLHKKLEPLFRDLSSPELLAKCLHGKAQNNNASLNGVIYGDVQKIPLLVVVYLKQQFHQQLPALTLNTGKSPRLPKVVI